MFCCALYLECLSPTFHLEKIAYPSEPGKMFIIHTWKMFFCDFIVFSIILYFNHNVYLFYFILSHFCHCRTLLKSKMQSLFVFTFPFLYLSSKSLVCTTFFLIALSSLSHCPLLFLFYSWSKSFYMKISLSHLNYSKSTHYSVQPNNI